MEAALIIFLLVQVLTSIGPCAERLKNPPAKQSVKEVVDIATTTSISGLLNFSIKEIRVILLAMGLLGTSVIVYKKLKPNNEKKE